MRISAVLLLILSLAACNRGNQSNEAVRLGVVDYLTTKAQLNVAAMDISLSSVKFDGSKAEAMVSIRPKANPEQGMNMGYKLEQQGQKWVVTGKVEAAGAAQHGGTMPPAAAPNPHGGDPAAGGGAGKMPSPEDLPPAGKKK